MPSSAIVCWPASPRAASRPDRIALHGATTRQAYLAAHAEVDVLLDTFPFTGGTTTCEALWMGVPTVTLEGHTMLTRQGASLMRTVGLDDWVAPDARSFVDIVLARAGDLPRLAALRLALRERARASPLFDAPRFAASLAQALARDGFVRPSRRDTPMTRATGRSKSGKKGALRRKAPFSAGASFRSPRHENDYLQLAGRYFAAMVPAHVQFRLPLPASAGVSVIVLPAIAASPRRRDGDDTGGLRYAGNPLRRLRHSAPVAPRSEGLL